MYFQGWVKLHRKLMENEVIWDTKEPFDRRSAWLYLVMMANHEDRQIAIGGSVRVIHRGEHWTSFRSLKEKWHWDSIDRVRRYINMLVEAKMITVNSTSNGTLVTIVNYGDYQGSQDTKRDTKQYTDKYTGETQTSTRALPKQEVKNIKNEKEVKKCSSASPYSGGEWQ